MRNIKKKKKKQFPRVTYISETLNLRNLPAIESPIRKFLFLSVEFKSWESPKPRIFLLSSFRVFSITHVHILLRELFTHTVRNFVFFLISFALILIILFLLHHFLELIQSVDSQIFIWKIKNLSYLVFFNMLLVSNTIGKILFYRMKQHPSIFEFLMQKKTPVFSHLQLNFISSLRILKKSSFDPVALRIQIGTHTQHTFV